jgi:hypothetical protein
MTMARDDRQDLKLKAKDISGRLSSEERERILIKCWMSHDARWFAAAAQAHGMEAANQLNQTAVREEGKVEARRIARALELPPVDNVDDYLVLQEIMIGLLGPDLLDYEVERKKDDSFELRVQRCFAFDQVTRAGVASMYDCGILPRLQGWLDFTELGCEMSPEVGKCLKAQGTECAYSITLRPKNGS